MPRKQRLRGQLRAHCGIVIEVGMAPVQSVGGTPQPAAMQAAQMMALDELWRGSDAANYGLTQAEFNEILLGAAREQNWGAGGGDDAGSRTASGLAAGAEDQ